MENEQFGTQHNVGWVDGFKSDVAKMGGCGKGDEWTDEAESNRGGELALFKLLLFDARHSGFWEHVCPVVRALHVQS